MSPEKLILLSISEGNKTDFDFTYRVPFWEPNQFQQQVFIEFAVNQRVTGRESIYLYLDSVYISDAQGYQLLKRNATSKQEFLPLIADLEP